MPASHPLTDHIDPNAKSTFARRILPGIACLLAVALLAAAVAVIQIARTIDSDALVREHFLTGKAFEAHRRGMSRHVADNAFWGDAYANLSTRVNLDWAYEQANLGPSLYEDFGYTPFSLSTRTAKPPTQSSAVSSFRSMLGNGSKTGCRLC